MSAISRIANLVPDVLLPALILITTLSYFYSQPWVQQWWMNFSQHKSHYVIFATALPLTIVTYWIHVGAMAVIDLWQRPKYLWRRKIQPGKIPDKNLYLKVLGNVLVNQLIVAPLFGTSLFAISEWFGWTYSYTKNLPGTLELLGQLSVFLVIEELGFYYGHRWLHSTALYKPIHKKHHELTAPIGIAAIYCHPIEHILSNLLPLLLGPLVMRSHILLLWTWVVLGQANAINSHCGFVLPLMPSPLAHDYHHATFNSNFGVLGVLDRWHRTQGNFEEWARNWEKKIKGE
ncbi:uncharacterized protein VTP21DRAFT_2465 [Calcarisporiella thermophila]|uniref:uncharacterized protein n=1 Tax=Calcarisporiella thermophila TaxID=911321 RepID=UPI0037426FE4